MVKYNADGEGLVEEEENERKILTVLILEESISMVRVDLCPWMGSVHEGR